MDSLKLDVVKIWEDIKALDLFDVRLTFLRKYKEKYPLPKMLNKVEMEYRRFLFFVSTFPEKGVRPFSKEMDNFWHEHILHTKKYRADCQKIFGFYLDHSPTLSSKEEGCTTCALSCSSNCLGSTKEDGPVNLADVSVEIEDGFKPGCHAVCCTGNSETCTGKPEDSGR